MFRNLTLAALHDSDLAALRPHLVQREFERGDLLTGQGDEVDHVYFPTTAYISNSVTFTDGRSAQIFVMGVEGVSGLAAFLADEPCAWSIEVRSAGEAYQLPAAVLRRQAQASPALRLQLLRLAHDYQAQGAFSVGCAALHTAAARLAHFILTSADRTGDDRLQLTQQDIADFLSIQRTTVNAAANELKEAGAIRYSRGALHIIDRPELTRRACECYRLQAPDRRTRTARPLPAV